MIYDKARMAKLSGLLTETSHKGIKNSMADQFGGGKEEGDPWLDGEVTTEGSYDEENEGNMMHNESDEEEESVREMIRTELRGAKKEMEKEQVEEQAVREAVRKEIRSVMKSRGVTLGGLGHGFRR